MPDLIKVIEGMPTQTIAGRRDRAAIALIALTGVRDAALVSLRRKHIDPSQGRLNQDATEVDTKFGKNLWTHFFPVPAPIREFATAWVEELDSLDDPCDGPLLPRDVSPAGLHEPSPRKTAGPIRAIMKRACINAGIGYRPPHTIRHTLTVYGDEVCRTLLDKKAWSQNLGHSSLTTTELSYGRLDHQMVAVRLAGLASRGNVDDITAMLVEADPEDLEYIRSVLRRSKRLRA